MKTKNEYREHLADLFIKALEEDGLNWRKGWVGLETPKSAITNAPYHGINRFILTITAHKNGYEDPRWCTFKQIQDNGWKLEKGSKGTQIEYWIPLHPETNKPISWQTANELKRDNPDVNIRAVPQYYYVFNAERISGIPAREIFHSRNISINEIVPKISKNMEVKILNDTADSAYYSPKEDKIHLPKVERFLSSYDYYATAMHELAHASGAKSRLDRDLSGHFGTPKYAFEELVAEMSASFMSEHLPYELPADQLESHKAYLVNWMEEIKNNPDYLINAIKQADTCANYLEEKAELNLEKQAEINADEKLQQQIKGNEKLVLDMKSLGLEVVWEKGFSDDGFIGFQATNYNDKFGLPNWKAVEDFVEDVYRTVDNFNIEDIKARQQGAYHIISYGMLDDNVINASVANYENMIQARNKSLFSELPDAPSWKDSYLDMFQKGEFQKKTEQLKTDVKEQSFLENVKQIDRASGDIHIFQDKNDPQKNYLGKKVEHNGVKQVVKLSDHMTLKDAQTSLKTMLNKDPEQKNQNKKVRVSAIERG